MKKVCIVYESVSGSSVMIAEIIAKDIHEHRDQADAQGAEK